MDGANPTAGLLQATDGNFYGTTYAGGTADYGTIFKITPGGEFTALHTFEQTGTVRTPVAGLVQATDGNFYGTTFAGGSAGYGTAFKITPGGKLTTILTFDGKNGASPTGWLIQDTDGDLYGTASAGGAKGNGKIVKLSVGLRPFVQILPNSGGGRFTSPDFGNRSERRDQRHLYWQQRCFQDEIHNRNHRHRAEWRNQRDRSSSHSERYA